MRSPLTTLCYVEKDGCYLMLHRVSKKHDVNKDKWIGIGGHFEGDESPEECLVREAYEETGLHLTSWKFRGIVTFVSMGVDLEYMCLYTADGFDGELTSCNEGVLEWVPKEEVTKLNLWEGDKIFLKLMAEDAPFFSMKLMYQGDMLTYAALNGRRMELLDVCDENGELTGVVTERSVAHAAGVMHRTAHIWIVRQGAYGDWDVLLQKRSMGKDSFPGCYDTSSAGHVEAGDEYLESAQRELREELGIEASEEELEYAGRYDSGDILAKFRGRPFHDREITALYVYRRPVDAASLALQPEEVDSVRWMSYGEVRRAVEAGDPRFCINPEGFRLLGRYLEEHPRQPW